MFAALRGAMRPGVPYITLVQHDVRVRVTVRVRVRVRVSQYGGIVLVNLVDIRHKLHALVAWQGSGPVVRVRVTARQRARDRIGIRLGQEPGIGFGPGPGIGLGMD